MIFILAKNAEAAKQLALANDLLPKDWRYVYTPTVLHGVRNRVLWLGYDYTSHPDMREILDVAVYHCFRIFEVSEVPKYTLAKPT